MKLSKSVLVYTLIASALVGCGAPMPEQTLSPPYQLLQSTVQSLAPISVQWRPQPPASLTKGKTLDLNAWVYYSDQSAAQSVSWSVVDSSILDLDSTGKITGLKAGQTQVIAKSIEDESILVQAQMTVTNPVVTFPGKIVYLANQDLYLLNGSNQNPIQITNNGAQQSKLWPKMTWDGTKAIYGTDTFEVWSVALSANSTPSDEGLGPNTIAPLPFYYNQNEIVFQAQGGTYGANPMTHFKLPNNAVVPVTNVLQNGADTIAGVDNDGLAFYAHNGSIKRVVYNDISTTVTLVTGQTPDMARTLHPNRIVYTDQGDLKLIDFAGQSVPFPATPTITEQTPSISPDQSEIVFVSNHEGNQDLYMINANGTGLVNLTNTPTIDESMPDWGI